MTVSTTQYAAASRAFSMETYKDGLTALMEKHGVVHARADVDSWYLTKADGSSLSNNEIVAFSADVSELANETGVFSFKLGTTYGYWEGVREDVDSPSLKKFYFRKSESADVVELLRKQDWAFNDVETEDPLHDIYSTVDPAKFNDMLNTILLGAGRDPKIFKEVNRIRRNVRRLEKYNLTPSRIDGRKVFLTWNGAVATREQVQECMDDLHYGEETIADLQDNVAYLKLIYELAQETYRPGDTTLANLTAFTRARVEYQTAVSLLEHAVVLAKYKDEPEIEEVQTDHRFAGGDRKGHIDHTPLPE